jgi:hypothetical protein
MLISTVNLSNSVSDAEVQPVLRAINRQIEADFAPRWDLSAKLRLEARVGTQPERNHPPQLRGDAVMYLWDSADVDGAIGYHEENNAGLPCGFVFTEVAAALGEPWSVTLSHEALELVGDANVNKLAAGPHPEDPNRWVLHWYEMCDAVQAEQYEIDGVAVSNFVLPLYFTPGEQIAGRNDFLGTQHGGTGLASFGVNPGGYVGFVDPATGESDTWSRRGDKEATRRREVKAHLGASRRGPRYQQMAARVLGRTPARV